MPDTSRKLKGYRLGFLKSNIFHPQGASILDISVAPQATEEEFQLWWERENQKAARDGEALVVVKSRFDETFQGKCLEKIEEREFYATSFEQASRVRTITYATLRVAFSTPGRVVLADDWGDVIEKLPPASEDEKASCSESALIDDSVDIREKTDRRSADSDLRLRLWELYELAQFDRL